MTVSQRRQHPLIPRSAFFGNPDKADVDLSRDGAHISFLAPVDGVLNVWVAPVEDLEAARPITSIRKPGIRYHFWAYTHQHIIYVRDYGGDEKWEVHSVNVLTMQDRNLSNPKGYSARRPATKAASKPLGVARVEKTSAKRPSEIMIGINGRDANHYDLYKANVETGERTFFLMNYVFERLVLDDDYRVRLAIRYRNGDREVLKVSPSEGWTPLLTIPWADSFTTEIQGVDSTGDLVYLVDSRDGDEPIFKTIDVATGREESASDKGDEGEETGGCPHEEYLQSLFKHGRLRVVRRSTEGDLWLVTYESDVEPGRYYLYDLTNRRVRFLFAAGEALQRVNLARMREIAIRARDGLLLNSYLTLPAWLDPGDERLRPPTPLPMVLLVHGGPHARDDWGYDPDHQWLANRGYAVLSVNFRGSTGFGKNFVNAGRGLWGGAMQNDLIDAVTWAADFGIADKSRIAIMGASYGGYAALSGLAFTPDLFACGVDLVGCSDLTNGEVFRAPRDDTEYRQLAECSPALHARRISKPLLIGHGMNDRCVKRKESDQMVRAMQTHRLPVTYVRYPDEGHGFVRAENRLSFQAITEGFLSQHLGGRLEAVDHDLPGANLEVRSLGDGMKALRSFWNAMIAIREAERQGRSWLDLSAWGLTVLPPEIGRVKTLERLYLSHNQLRSLPDELTALSRLEELYVNDNQIAALPDGIGELGKLRVLRLDENRIEELSPEIGELRSMTFLSLRWNRLVTLPPETAKLRALEVLDVSSNQLLFLPRHIDLLRTLKVLNVSDNCLAEVPSQLEELERLRRLERELARFAIATRQPSGPVGFG